MVTKSLERLKAQLRKRMKNPHIEIWKPEKSSALTGKILSIRRFDTPQGNGLVIDIEQETDHSIKRISFDACTAPLKVGETVTLKYWDEVRTPKGLPWRKFTAERRVPVIDTVPGSSACRTQ